MYRLQLGISSLFLITSIPAMLAAKGSGPLLGVAVGIGLLLVLYKKTRVPIVILSILAISTIFILPSDHAVRQELFAQNRSGQLRIDMWGETAQLLTKRPIKGAGLASYKTVISPYRIDTWIEVFHHPHNLFLTIWVNTGIVGLIGFLWVLVWFFRVGIQHMSKHPLIPFLLASMSTILVMGLVDSPYIKNDLSLFFWALIALMTVTTIQRETDQT